MSVLTCDNARNAYHDARAGLLDADATADVAAHMADCAHCADWAARLESLLVATEREAEAAAARVDADALFDDILDAIDRPDSYADGFDDPADAWTDAGDDAASTDALGGPPATADTALDTSTVRYAPTPTDTFAMESDALRSSKARSFVWTALAAAFVGAALTWGLIHASAPATTPDAPVLAEAPVAPAPEPASYPELSERGAPSRGLTVRATPDAVWRYAPAEDDAPQTLTVERGTLIAEFLPLSDDPLRVRAGALRFEVVGTIFAVSADDEAPSVSVVVGEVAVDVDAEATPVRRGQRFVGGQVEVVPDDYREHLEAAVDVQMHEVQLAAIAARDNARRETAPTPDAPDAGGARAPAAHPPTRNPPTHNPAREAAPEETDQAAPESARDRARRAMASRRWAEAAEALEAQLAAGEADATTRLDLARLYLRRLDAPERAAGHLRSFLASSPDDPTAPTAQRELCDIAARLGTHESACAP